MNEKYFDKIAGTLTIAPRQVAATARLLAEGATVPFIARYRKEVTGSLDEVAITAVRDQLVSLVELDQRRDSILKSLQERNLLTDALRTAIAGAETITRLEDIYQPFRPKRRTRAMMAAEKGLGPLAEALFEGQASLDPLAEAAKYVSTEKGVETTESALAGARDIIAERVSDDARAREKMRALYTTKAVVRSKVLTGKEQEGAKFKDYFEWSEPLTAVPSHRMLAMRRGEQEGFLMLRIQPPEEEALSTLEGLFVKAPGKPAAEQVRLAVQDSYKRLLSGQRSKWKCGWSPRRSADEAAIRVFAENLRELMLAPPLGRKTVLAIDPGFRTGCKVVCLDRQGKLLHYDVIFTHTLGDFQR
jgi:protein Tex